jgi:hypothetical protein
MGMLSYISTVLGVHGHMRSVHSKSQSPAEGKNQGNIIVIIKLPIDSHFDFGQFSICAVVTESHIHAS